jgi:signal transduction histidine kinase
MDRLSWRYLAVVATCAAAGLLLSFTDLASSIDAYASDWVFRLHEPAWGPPEAILLTIDESTQQAMRSRRQLRRWVAHALTQIAPAAPKAIGVDLIFVEPDDDAEDATLAAALAQSQRLVLGADLVKAGGRELPLARFRPHAAALGHVHAEPDPVSRVLPLMKAHGTQRLWAMCLETYRQAHPGLALTESPTALQLGPLTVPASRAQAYPLTIRYRRPGVIPQVSLKQLRDDPRLAELFRGKVVFLGYTTQSEVKDRLMTPLGEWMAGVEIHAHAYETLRTGAFLQPARQLAVVTVCLAIAALAGVVFFRPPGWLSYSLGAVLLLSATALPHLLYPAGIVFPAVAPALVALLTIGAAAAFQYFLLRDRWRIAESDKARYRQAIHFVAHEMRTPLSAIQGSSELMTRYNLNDDKRKQMATMINAESKRLARMITTFLDIERLSDGSMDLKREPFSLNEAVDLCIERARVLADRKQMQIVADPAPPITLAGDRELFEYAIYNLLTNAVKYSPAETTIHVRLLRQGDRVSLAVADQGMGMDEKELKNIFQKFYRTKRAEQAGIEGTGIGLSLVQEIVHHHGGRISVTSRPGEGSCFTLELPALATESAAKPA